MPRYMNPCVLNYYYITPKGDGNAWCEFLIHLAQVNYYYITPKGDGNENLWIEESEELELLLHNPERGRKHVHGFVRHWSADYLPLYNPRKGTDKIP